MIKNSVYRIYFARCMNIFNSLLSQLVKYDVHTTRKINSIYAIFYHILSFYIRLPGGGSKAGQIFRIGTVHYAEGLWRMCRHGPVRAHCTDSEDFPWSSAIYQYWSDRQWCAVYECIHLQIHRIFRIRGLLMWIILLQFSFENFILNNY